MSGGKQTGSGPWRIPVIWLIAGIPAVSVVVGVVLLALSIAHYDGLVADDYYKQGMGINQSMERTARARELGIDASLRSFGDSLIEIRLSSNPEYTQPGELRVSFRHATRSGFDQAIMAANLDQGIYRLYLPPLPPGKWHVEITADGWKVNRILNR
ncbi:MAG: FixH family protein [Gammaproteobacteria bacterium]|nr:FixH family protein [Gammaproteobacteria bacterium]MYJ52158.1 FixH family protein [Gammaproteobacteria bacterium]